MTEVPVLDRIDLYVDHWAGSRPDAEFLVDGGPQITGRRLTWTDARVEIDRVAAALVAAGSTRGDRVAFLGDSRLDFFIHFLAATSIGCIWQGLNPKYTWDELAFVVADAAPRLIFDGTMVGDRIGERLAEQIDEVERTIVLGQANWEAFLTAGGDVDTGELDARQATVESSDPALIVYTSGSTGRPKGALLTHRGVCWCGVTGSTARGGGEEKVICNLPVNHVGAVSDICARAMISGGTVVFQERFDPELMLATIETEEVQVWAGVPTIFQICLAHPTFPNVDLSCVEHVAWGGAAMSLPVLEALLAATGAGRASVGYGMTESTGAVTSTTPESTLEQLTTTVGVPIPGHDYRIVTEDGTQCKVGESGEIQIRGDWIMAGYWNRPEATAPPMTAGSGPVTWLCCATTVTSSWWADCRRCSSPVATTPTRARSNNASRSIRRCGWPRWLPCPIRCLTRSDTLSWSPTRASPPTIYWLTVGNIWPTTRSPRPYTSASNSQCSPWARSTRRRWGVRRPG